VGGILGPLDAPEALLLGRPDEHGRLQVAGRTTPLTLPARRELGALLVPPAVAAVSGLLFAGTASGTPSDPTRPAGVRYWVVSPGTRPPTSASSTVAKRSAEIGRRGGLDRVGLAAAHRALRAGCSHSRTGRTAVDRARVRPTRKCGCPSMGTTTMGCPVGIPAEPTRLRRRARAYRCDHWPLTRQWSGWVGRALDTPVRVRAGRGRVTRRRRQTLGATRRRQPSDARLSVAPTLRSPGAGHRAPRLEERQRGGAD